MTKKELVELLAELPDDAVILTMPVTDDSRFREPEIGPGDLYSIELTVHTDDNCFFAVVSLGLENMVQD